MSFTDEQKAALAAKLDGRHVKQRSQNGMTLSYVEGWLAIAEANRIFGFDGWSRETVDTVCVWSGERDTKSGPKPAASYICKVRVTAGGVTREGTGSGSGFGKDVGEAHESAVKEAETDAMKRALMTFGNPFGLALYDKDQENVERTRPIDKATGPKGALHVDAIGAARAEMDPSGTAPSQYQIDKAAKAKAATPAERRAKAEAWTGKSIAAIKDCRTAQQISDWWDGNSQTLDRLHDEFNDLYEKIDIAASERTKQVPAIMSAA